MKTEFVDVNETRKNRARRNSERRGRRRDRPRRARLLAQGARPRASGRARCRRASSSSASRIRSCTTSRTTSSRARSTMRCARRGVEPVDTPDVRDVDDRGGPAADVHGVVRHGAAVRAGRLLRRSRCARASSAVDDEAVDAGARSGCASAAARYEPVEGRGVERRRHRHGRSRAARRRRRRPTRTRTSASRSARRRTRPGFDEQLLGLEAGATKTFTIHYPADYADRGAGRHRRRVHGHGARGSSGASLPELDDEFAKDLGEFETLDALRARVREDLEHEARHAAEREVRARADEAAGGARAVRGAGVAGRARDRSAARGLRAAADASRTSIRGRPASTGTRSARASARSRARRSAAALVLDEVARREQLEVTDDEVEARGRAATPSGRAGRRRRCARALEKEGGLVAGLRGAAAGEGD